MKTISSILFSAALMMVTFNAAAQTSAKEKSVEIGGAMMNPAKDMVANIGNSKDHTTLMAVIKAADMVETLQSAGPFTIFAPVNAAFDQLPAGTVTALLKVENKGNLNIILKYHVVPGKITTADISRLIKAGNGTAMLTTVAGKNLVLSADGNKFAIKDEKGSMAFITIKDVNLSNGIVQVIDHVLLPKEL